MFFANKRGSVDNFVLDVCLDEKTPYRLIGVCEDGVQRLILRDSKTREILAQQETRKGITLSEDDIFAWTRTVVKVLEARREADGRELAYYFANQGSLREKAIEELADML